MKNITYVTISIPKNVTYNHAQIDDRMHRKVTESSMHRLFDIVDRYGTYIDAIWIAHNEPVADKYRIDRSDMD